MNIRIIAPSLSLTKEDKTTYETAINRLEEIGYTLSFGKNIKNKQYLGISAPVSKRVDDFMNAMCSEDVDIVMALDGGWLANGLLDRINWEMLKSNKKFIVGYSDISVLLSACFSKKVGRPILGPNLLTIGNMKNYKAALNNLEKAMEGNNKDEYIGKIINPGTAKGKIFGGNLGSLYLCQGTQYFPEIKDEIVLVIEDDDEPGKNSLCEFDRRVTSLLSQNELKNKICCVLVGKFQPGSKIKKQLLINVLREKFGNKIPVAYDLDFGHEKPLISFMLNDKVQLTIKNDKIRIRRIYGKN